MIFAAAFFIGIIYRLVFFTHSVRCLPISTDEAFIGLLAKDIIRGALPLVSFGTGYQGPLEPYLNAPILFFLSPSAFSIRILTFAGSVMFLFLIYKLGKYIFGKETGLLSLLFCGIPPMYLVIAQSISIAPYNNTLLVFGTIILILGLKPQKKLFYFSMLGFLAGIMFWVTPLIICYLIPVILFLFARDKLFFLKKESFLGLVFFVLGSLPLWINSFSHNFENFQLARSVPWHVMFNNLKFLFSFTLPAILGFHTPLYLDNTNFIHLPKILSIPYALVLGILFLICLIKFRRTWVLLVFFAVVLFVFAKSLRANWWALRYLEPLYTVLPVLLAFGIYNIWKRSKIAAGTFACIILFCNIYSGVSVYRLWGDKDFVQDKLELPDTGELIKFLEEEGINRGYGHYWIAYRLTFETNERIIISPPMDERFGRYEPPYLETVLKSPPAAYIFQKGLGRVSPEVFEENLNLIGGEYTKKKTGYFTVFYAFKSPCRGLEIPRDGWILESNFRDADTGCAIDGDLSTRWGSGTAQKPGMYFLIDLGSIKDICKIRFDLGGFVTDMPRAYKIEVSADKESWQRVYENKGDCILFWDENQPRYLIDSYFNCVFKPIHARYVRITQTGTDERFDWSIAEVKIYEQKTD